MAIPQLLVGEQTSAGTGVPVLQRGGQLGDTILSELHGQYYEQVYRGNVWYIGGVAEVALSANSISLTATTTPITGIWNPLSSSVNCVMLYADLMMSLNVTSATRQGAWFWAMSTNNGAISTGASCFNAKTLAVAGPKGASATKGFVGGIALTAITNNLVIQRPAKFNVGINITTASFPATALSPLQCDREEFKGALIVPPGGVLALLNGNSTTNMSCVAGMCWEEVPV